MSAELQAHGANGTRGVAYLSLAGAFDENTSDLEVTVVVVAEAG